MSAKIIQFPRKQAYVCYCCGTRHHVRLPYDNCERCGDRGYYIHNGTLYWCPLDEEAKST